MSGLRVLIVDDNALSVELARLMLEGEAFVVESAGDAVQALRKVGCFMPELILMDMHLPGMDGLALTRHLKADASLRHIVIVGFTASALKSDETRMREAGCDGYLSKVMQVETFADRVLSFVPGVVPGQMG